jgi:VanZ family protein
LIVFSHAAVSSDRAAAALSGPRLPTMKIMQRKILLNWLPVVGLCTVIFVQSSFAAPDLGPVFPFKDKVLHMAAYGLLAVLCYRACRLTWPGHLHPAPLLTISVLFATLYGVSDEFHQSFVAARQADVWDWIADFAGSLIGAAGYMIINQSRRGNEIRSHQERDRHAESTAGNGSATHSQ